MSKNRKHRIQDSGLFDDATKDIIKKDLEEIYGDQETDLKQTKEAIKKNFLFNPDFGSMNIAF